MEGTIAKHGGLPIYKSPFLDDGLYPFTWKRTTVGEYPELIEKGNPNNVKVEGYMCNDRTYNAIKKSADEV